MFRKTPKMAPVSSYKLKDPRVCRVFVSSPFGGYEKEREELVLKYFPQLSHLCQGRGVQFVAVDMRWGITEEAATDAQVVSICLREVDRSDIFIGFYGQRYGWHGAKDPMLQKNIDNAKKRYPWLTKVKDRSVTEMEFLHGHLNSPGALPSIMAFRSKSYDDQKRKKAEEKKNSREATKFTVESSEANKLLTSLKERVASTKAKCVAFNDDYKTPE
ncbi:TPR repeat-containing protein DDB_G0287407, partial [Aplysia californica]|uniref:TPR repeat-containing protein DDB_G0287407 n=1 Tax=Aplysia californica TaxID=6500 RepID=A0ABM0K3Q5_APLCA